MDSFLFLSLLAFEAVAQTYCISGVGPSTTLDSNLGPTTLIGDTRNIDERNDCPGYQGVQDLTTLSADLSNKIYVLNTTVSTCGGVYPTLAGAWIDWNQDMNWGADEALGPFSGGKGSLTWSFSVPADAKSGTTRMRVQVQETYQTFMSPCSAFNYGGTKDFSVQVNAGPPPPPVDPYCVSGPLTTEDANLGAVTLIGEFQNIREKSDCPGITGVQNFLNLVGDVEQGTSYSIQFNVTTCGGLYTTLSAVWIDWDHDLVFNSSDLIGSYTQQKGLVTLNFTPPTTPYTGNTVMRVQVQETESTKLDPCATFSFGGTKDFTITILPRGTAQKKNQKN